MKTFKLFKYPTMGASKDEVVEHYAAIKSNNNKEFVMKWEHVSDKNVIEK